MQKGSALTSQREPSVFTLHVFGHVCPQPPGGSLRSASDLRNATQRSARGPTERPPPPRAGGGAAGRTLRARAPLPARRRLLPPVAQPRRLRLSGGGHVGACRRSRRRNGAVGVRAGRLPAAGRPPAPVPPRLRRAAPCRLPRRAAAPRRRG